MYRQNNMHIINAVLQNIFAEADVVIPYPKKSEMRLTKQQAAMILLV